MGARNAREAMHKVLKRIKIALKSGDFKAIILLSLFLG
jgi:hypothetical protein